MFSWQMGWYQHHTSVQNITGTSYDTFIYQAWWLKGLRRNHWLLAVTHHGLGSSRGQGMWKGWFHFLKNISHIKSVHSWAFLSGYFSNSKCDRGVCAPVIHIGLFEYLISLTCIRLSSPMWAAQKGCMYLGTIGHVLVIGMRPNWEHRGEE